MNNQNQIKISEETQIDLPTNRILISIEKRDWKRVRRYVNEINDSYNRWENAAWSSFSLAFGIGISTFFSTTDAKTKIVFYVVGACFILISIILFVVSREKSKSMQRSRGQVLVEMDEIQSNFGPKIDEEKEGTNIPPL